MRFQIRMMTQSDLPEILRLERELFSEPWSEQMFKEDIDKEDSYVLINSSPEEKIDAYICGWRILDEYHITNFGVKSCCQRTGLGSVLLDQTISNLKKSGCTKFYLEVRQSNIPAIKLYLKFGFRIIGIRKRYYDNPPEAALIMTLIDEKEE